MLISMPQLGWILGFCAMASLGLPGLAGFWGEFPAILSAYSPLPEADLSQPLYRTLMVIAAFGTVLAAAYLLWLYQRTAFGEPEDYVAGTATTVPPTAHAVGAGRQRRPGRHDGDGDGTTTTSTTSRRSSGSRGCRCSCLILVLGFYPQLLFKVFDPAVDRPRRPPEEPAL